MWLRRDPTLDRAGARAHLVHAAAREDAAGAAAADGAAREGERRADLLLTLRRLCSPDEGARRFAEDRHLDHLAPVEVAPREAREHRDGEEAEDGR